MNSSTKSKKGKKPTSNKPESYQDTGNTFTTDMRFIVTRSKLNVLVDEFDESVPVPSSLPIYH